MHQTLPLTITVAQVTPGELHVIEFQGTNTIFKWVFRQLKIDGVVGAPHAILIKFEDTDEDDITVFDLNHKNRYISLGNQIGTVWHDVSEVGYVLREHATTLPFRTLSFRVFDFDTGLALTFSRLSMKLDGCSTGGVSGNLTATNKLAE